MITFHPAGKPVGNQDISAMTPCYNFSAGPSLLPEPVVQQIREDLPNWNGQGTSIMEISHRSPAFNDVVEESQALLRELLKLPHNYHILWMQGGASSQFSLVPMNLLDRPDAKAGYLVSGSWGQKAFDAAHYHTQPHLIANGAPDYDRLPPRKTWDVPDDLDYLHITSNETIHGLQFHHNVNINDIPLVIDGSSDILCRPLPYDNFGLMYAGAQKNLGPAGVTLVIIRDDLLARSGDRLAPMFNYQSFAAKNSLYNTPPVFSWYVCCLVLRWIKAEGGIEAIHRQNQNKAFALYSEIGRDDFYHNPVEIASRSLMNVPFRIHKPELESLFLEEAQKAGFIGLKGHRSVGGLRASLYNAITPHHVFALVKFMQSFKKQHG